MDLSFTDINELYPSNNYYYERENKWFVKQHLMGNKDLIYCTQKCGKSFARQSDYTYHLKWECGRVFVCNICGRNFQRLRNIKQHKVRVHYLAYDCKIEESERVILN